MRTKTNRRDTKRAARRRDTVAIRLTRFGHRVETLDLPTGTTVKDLVKAHRLGTYSVRVNRKPPRLARVLKDGDVVVAVPQRVSGVSGDRYDGLDLERCRRTMSPHDFQFFVSFVGADTLGFKDGDLDPV